MRHRGDLSPCGQSPMDFESITLTTRSQCHARSSAGSVYYCESRIHSRTGCKSAAGLLPPNAQVRCVSHHVGKGCLWVQGSTMQLLSLCFDVGPIPPLGHRFPIIASQRKCCTWAGGRAGKSPVATKSKALYRAASKLTWLVLG